MVSTINETSASSRPPICLCSGPRSWRGAKLPCVGCNDNPLQAWDFPFKLYTYKRTDTCPVYKAEHLIKACLDVCEWQYEKCCDGADTDDECTACEEQYRRRQKANRDLRYDRECGGRDPWEQKPCEDENENGMGSN
ncbi:uncharacterized protein BDZ99DRAFT_514185 [Mytilinidion resinicola]|uniref:Uncharacterized protein n=1 Tax=Mytilinidion resinicola TaxID=574789 RepID=A0A6A6ZCB6_9PEZI|nr:uncharacterized protein BDZ99DRAFT_514185 [Mytilinidion resinicola]KAF2817964.1 hypothetical protein BDZ99DRAFT_514185 [Mytilinidion resinicola]